MNYKEYKILGILGLKSYESVKEKYFDMKYLSTLSNREVSSILEELDKFLHELADKNGITEY